MTASVLRAHGMAVEVRDGWEARVYRRASGPHEQAETVVHLATFPLPPERGDFGAGAVEAMGRDDVFVALFEYGDGAASQPLFAHEGWPVLDPGMFSPQRLQRSIAGQSGTQWFFRVDKRAFCLYVVLGSHARRHALTPAAMEAVNGIRLGEEQ